MTTEDVVRALAAEWLDPTLILRVERLEGGYLNDVFRIDVAGRDSLVLRIYALPTTVEMVASEQTLVGRLANHLPEVPRPLPASNGATLVETTIGGERRVAAMSPFLNGVPLDPQLAEDRTAAARALARLHAAMASIDGWGSRPGRPAWAELDWRGNDWWQWDDCRRLLRDEDCPLEARQRDDVERRLSEEMEALPARLDRLAALGLPAQPIHGDYYAGNLLVRDGEVTGILDWDECRLDWRAFEVSSALWSFCRLPAKLALDAGRTAAFIADYRSAGGEFTEVERGASVELIRITRFGEALYTLGRDRRGLEVEWDYLVSNVEAIQYLDGVDAP